MHAESDPEPSKRDPCAIKKVFIEEKTADQAELRALD